MAGLVGAGRTELARAVFGIDRPVGGGIAPRRRADRHRARRATPSTAASSSCRRTASGPAWCSNSRSPRTSRSPTSQPSPACLLIRTGAERRNAVERSAALDIRTASVDTMAGTLSGGNQQKVVLAKWLSMKPKVVIFDEPTRGIDVGAKSEIYQLMRGLADAGVAVLMISSDMEEVIGVSDRIVVMHEGAISGFLTRPSSARRT